MLDTLYDKVCQLLATGRWYSAGTPVSSTIKTDRHEITEILLKVVLNTITLTPIPIINCFITLPHLHVPNHNLQSVVVNNVLTSLYLRFSRGGVCFVE